MENGSIFWMALAALVGIFILCREVMCWYWKINTTIKNQEKIISNQESTEIHLKRIIELQEGLLTALNKKE